MRSWTRRPRPLPCLRIQARDILLLWLCWPGLMLGVAQCFIPARCLRLQMR